MLQMDDCRVEAEFRKGMDAIVRRVVHEPTGDRFWVKTKPKGVMNQRVLGRLTHEHRMLKHLANVPGVVRIRFFEHETDQCALWLADDGSPTLDRI